MKFSITWLKDHLETDASLAEIAEALNRIGHEVEGIEDPAERLAGFRVAKVLAAEKHPDADKLQVLSVDTGEGDPLQVVCGAPNARAGMKGVLGLPGATVPSNGMQLRKSAIRGVESNGMMCSVRELELGDEHDGIIELPEDATVGHSFADYSGSSPVLDVAITPNRPDCMGVYGIARDLAAAGLGTLKPIATPDFAASGACPVEIRTDDADGCPAFYGRVIKGVTNGPSPDWLQQRLTSAGQRPISLLVDLTNYLMLAYGRPAHAYDLAKLTGAVVARRAQDGERVLALNEKTYALDSSMTVIADDSGVHDIAGIMGGEDSGVTDSTTDVLLEIAYFDPERIGVTGRKLGLASDARTRFERGVDPEFLDAGLDLLTGLIVELAGGEPSETVRAGTAPTDAMTLTFDPALVAKLGGVEVGVPEQRAILIGLGFVVDENWNVTVPLRRHDIEGTADLVEEIVRIHGLDKVASVPLPRPDGVAQPTATPQQAMERKLRRAAAASGLNEAITWSFISEEQAALVGGGRWSLENPISEDMKVMRPSLLPGLLSAVQRNLDRGASSVRLFEIGRRYLESGEHPTLVCLLAGEKHARSWDGGKPAHFDAFDAKALCLSLLEAAGAPVGNLMVMGEAGDVYHPGQSATLRLGPKKRIASFGMLHPSTLKAIDVDVPVAALGIHLDEIPAKKNASFARSSYAPPALQAVTRDFAFLVPDDLAAADLVRATRGADKKNVVDARVFDVFAGQGVPEGKKSIAIEVMLQPQDQSYKDAELKAISDAVVAAVAKLGAELRG
ncbi:phenylalanine--tRNA ligase subunit beta [Parerythrobacter jejuensis]|uniref:Phenylalanine--tRNA ligase beta subunit n=1 Tax=Parerythrobacter jejuensis TaxID=795812 RepID=A0A845AVD4_9SPHN|nr:phenylalanine--tRNA ligase subunit beta [Parerythrobacter jejuensis]MXP30788.1 phenylalanine--tRNA ligase subunit beta [Parerythrobacter jejuensis]MXP33548.1 phenylalanine--tRNA ligase subunit beta [Parerythrobacter jejuensis]